MLLHLPHFCNSLFALPLMPWPAHGARRAAGQFPWVHAPHPWLCLPARFACRLPPCAHQHPPVAPGRCRTHAGDAWPRKIAMGHGCDHADLRHDPWGWRCLSLAEPQTLHRESGWSATGCVSTGAIPWSVGGGAGDGGRPQRWARCPSGDRLPPPCGVWPIMGAQGEAGVHEDMVRSDERPECVPSGDAPAYLRETPRVPTGDAPRTYGRRISP